jgi:HAMP domain-containing protein
MTDGRKQRKLRNVWLTRRYHFRYFGLWVLLVMFLVISFNAVIYLLIESRWEDIYTLPPDALRQYLMQRQAFVAGLAAEGVILTVGTVFLAMLTAHRIAGPYIRLRIAFKEVTTGNFDHVLKFRQYDHLEDVAEAFNKMMDRVRTEIKTAD